MKQRIPKTLNALSQILYTFSLVFLGIGLFSLGWAVWPVPSDGVQLTIPAGPLAGAPPEQPLVSLTTYSLEISWPRWMRRGEAEAIHLRLTDLDHTPLAAEEMWGAQIVLVEPALYPLHIDPPGGVQANLGDDQELLLTWTVTGQARGSYPGKMYVSFGFFEAELGELLPVPVAVVDLHIQVIELWGLEPGLVIWLGFVSLVLWGALFVLGRAAAIRT